VRARITDEPTAFPWSSCAALRVEREDRLLTLHPTQCALGPDDAERATAYRALLEEAIGDDELPPCASTCSNSAPTAETTSARWSKRRRDASPASDPRIDLHARLVRRGT
jgi:hypothetical protein